jgi:hypothetical protein
MTTPSITYGHGKLYDFDSVAAWSEQADDHTPAPDPDGTFAVLNGDWLDLSNTSGGEYRVCNTVALGINPLEYTKILVRYFTTADIKAKIILEDSGTDHFQTLLADTTELTMGLASATIGPFTDADNLAYIWLYADHAIGHVYCDFALICQGIFPFPNDGFSLDFTPSPRYADIGIPSRDGDISQQLGSGNSEVDISCDLNIGNWKRSADYINGQVFTDIVQAASHIGEPWQWLDTGEAQFKVTLRPPIFHYTGAERRLTLNFREYRLSTAHGETDVQRWGLNL